MAAAALTPRVRLMAICDDATPSDIESGVYTLEGVRQGIVADRLPCRRDLVAFLVLSCPRPGTHSGWVQVVNPLDKVIRWQGFAAAFDGNRRPVSLDVSLANTVFSLAGEYTVGVWFQPNHGEAVQKGEQSLLVAEE